MEVNLNSPPFYPQIERKKVFLSKFMYCLSHINLMNYQNIKIAGQIFSKQAEKYIIM